MGGTLFPGVLPKYRSFPGRVAILVDGRLLGEKTSAGKHQPHLCIYLRVSVLAISMALPRKPKDHWGALDTGYPIPKRVAALPLRTAVRSAAGRPAAAARSTGSLTPMSKG
jgi:hypothetical protein